MVTWKDLGVDEKSKIKNNAKGIFLEGVALCYAG